MNIYRINVTLADIHPPVRRRIEVPGDIKLGRLHRVLQAVMGWQDYHLHQFVVGGVTCGIPDPDFPDDTKSERSGFSNDSTGRRSR